MRTACLVLSSLIVLTPALAAAQTDGESSDAPSSAAPASAAPTEDHEPPASEPATTAPAPEPTHTSESAAAPATPPPTSEPATRGNAASRHDAHPHEDDGRDIDFLFIQAEGGFSYIDLTGLSSMQSVLPSLRETSGYGYGGGGTIGFRVWLFAVAAHAYVAHFDNQLDSGGNGFDLGQVMAEAQLRVPLPVIEPYVRVDFGYAWLGNFQYNSMYAMSTSNIDGWTGSVGAGIDAWIGKVFTLGLGVDLGAVNLRRGGVMRSGSMCPPMDATCVELTQDGDAFGTLVHAHVQAGLHF